VSGNGTIVTMTIAGVPVSLNSVSSLVDCVVTVVSFKHRGESPADSRVRLYAT
jgi:hypothetical protein